MIIELWFVVDFVGLRDFISVWGCVGVMGDLGKKCEVVVLFGGVVEM